MVPTAGENHSAAGPLDLDPPSSVHVNVPAEGESSDSILPARDPRRARWRFLAEHPLVRFVLWRVAAGLGTLLVVSVIIFLATSVLPGSAAILVLGHNASPQRIAALNFRLGLDHPLPIRYWNWLFQLLHGNLGRSSVALALSQPNSSISASIGAPLANSFILGIATAVLLIPLTLILGLIAAVRARRVIDHVISVPSLVFAGLPEFVTGTLFIYIFFTVLNVLPPVAILGQGQSPLSDIRVLVLPVLTLLCVALGSGVRQVRAGVIEVLDQDYIRFARLNGVRERRVLRRYALRNALAPSVQTIAQNLQYLVGGIIIVESIFAYPGIGLYLVQAVLARDTPEVEAAAMILAALYTGINIVADLIVVFLVPKLRTAVS